MRILRLLAAAAAILAIVPHAAGAQQSQEPIKIGLITSYSGQGNVELGKAVDGGIQAFMRMHGARIGGRQIQLIRRDDTGIAPETARRLAQELIVQEKVDILLGTIYTPNAIATAQVSTQAKKPYFIINAATSNIIKNAPYASRYGFNTAALTTPYGKWAYEQGARSAYVLFQDYGPGIDAGQAFEKGFTAAGGKVVGEGRIPVGTSDFSAYIQRAKDAKPNVLYIFLNASGGGIQLLKAFKESGIDKLGIKVLASGDIVDEPILQQTGDAAVGLLSMFNYSSWHNSALNREFVRLYQVSNQTKERPDFIACQAFDAISAIYKVVEAQHGQIDPDKTMELVKALKFESPRGPLQMNPGPRDPIQNGYIRRTERRNGGLENIEIVTLPNLTDPNE